MNADTGRFYYGQEEIEAAKERGEPVIELSPSIIDTLGVLPVQTFEEALAEQHRRLEEAMTKASAKSR